MTDGVTDEMLMMQIYFVNALVCFAVLLFLYLRNLFSGNAAEYHRHFLRRLFYATLCGITECVYAVMRLCSVVDPRVYNVLAVIFFSSCTLHCYRSYRFDRRYVRFDAPHAGLALRFVSKIPAAFAVALVVLSCFTGFVFSFEEDTLQYGPGFIVYLLLSYGYLVFSMFSAFKRYYRNDVISSGRFRQLLLLESVNLILFVLKRFIADLPLALIGMMLTSLMLYTLIVDTTIVYDALTKVLAKDSIHIVIERKMRWNEDFYLVIMDIDRFKLINDTFGHNEGDKTLIRLGGALNDVGRSHGASVGRIGGDEFCIVSEDEPTELLRDLQRKIDAINAEETRYTLAVSCGVCRRTPQIRQPADLISIADSYMYETKREKKQQEKEKVDA